MLIVFGPLFAALAIVSTGAVQVAGTQQAASDDIVVTGSRVRLREFEKMALAVTLPGDFYHQPLARFPAPVCPAVVGMPDDFSAALTARIRSVASRAKIRIASTERCKANLIVVFLPSGQSAMQNLLHGGPWQFGSLAAADLHDLANDPALKDLAAEPGPVHAWANTEMRGRDGQAIASANGAGSPETLTTGDSASRLTMAVRKDIVGSLVVIDAAAVRDLTASQLADYVAMRGLVVTRPPANPGKVATILNLFDAHGTKAPELTKFDLAYLRAVYSSSANVAGVTKLAQVPREVRKAADDE